MRPDRYHLFYILNDRDEPVPVDVETAAAWFETHDRRVALTRIGSATVSTVFLSINHNSAMRGPAVLWETMVFGGWLDQWQWRYTSKSEALRGHAVVVKLVKAANAQHRRYRRNRRS